MLVPDTNCFINGPEPTSRSKRQINNILSVEVALLSLVTARRLFSVAAQS